MYVCIHAHVCKHVGGWVGGCVDLVIPSAEYMELALELVPEDVLLPVKGLCVPRALSADRDRRRSNGEAVDVIMTSCPAHFTKRIPAQRKTKGHTMWLQLRCEDAFESPTERGY
jgi:hypothetical protein